MSTQNTEKTVCGVKDQERDYGHFKIKQKVGPNSLPNFIDSKRSDYLDYAFSKDIVWAESVIARPNFYNTRSGISARSGTLSSMFVNCLKDVSALLAMIRSVRECNIEVHLEEERALLPQLVAFGRPNYSRYMTYQHALLEVYCISNKSIGKDLKENGFGGSLTRDKFSRKHGDLLIETTVNRNVNVCVEPMQDGYSTD